MIYICARCGGPQHQDLVNIQALAEREPRFIPGHWDACEGCGWTGQPVAVQTAPSMALVAYGPPVPTPEDILRGAGLL